MNELSKEKTMTTNELADILAVSDRTIRRHAEDMGMTSPGKQTYITELQAIEIKNRIRNSGRNDLDNVVQLETATNDIEMRQKAAEVMVWLMRDNEQLKAKNAALEPKAESYDALQRSTNTMSISNCAKHFGLHPKTEVLPYLRERGYLTIKDLPSQSAIDADILALIQNVVRSTGMAYSQAVVRASQLEAWRLRVVPQIKKWIKK